MALTKGWMISMNLNDYSYDEIKIGQKFDFKKLLAAEDIENFAKLTGDFNPLHCDDDYAKSTRFRGRIAHGMLAASLFSTIVGMLCPGKRSLYLSQSLNFKKPIPLNSEVIVRGTVKDKIKSINVISLHTEVIYNGEVAVNGEAKVKVLGD